MPTELLNKVCWRVHDLEFCVYSIRGGECQWSEGYTFKEYQGVLIYAQTHNLWKQTHNDIETRLPVDLSTQWWFRLQLEINRAFLLQEMSGKNVKYYILNILQGLQVCLWYDFI